MERIATNGAQCQHPLSLLRPYGSYGDGKCSMVVMVMISTVYGSCRKYIMGYGTPGNNVFSLLILP